MKRFDTINPCLNCETKECGLVDGQECQKCIDYLSLKKDFETIKKEYEFTREYIHDNGLEWDLLSKWSARKGCEVMPRYIDAEKMPSGPLWDELTDKEKLNVLNYLLSASTSDVVQNIFEDIEELNSSIVDGQMFFFTKQFDKLKKKYGVEG